MKTQFRQFMFGSSFGENKVMNIGWLLFRVHVGLSIAIHAGWPKMNTISAPGWFAEQVSGLGFTFPSPEFWAVTASWGEFVGGILIAIGLFTRFAAAQLAFQFFVIAFLWYDKPEPLTGMYFQQLFFWCYVLVTFAGGGKYSLDKIVMQKRSRKIAGVPKIAITTVLIIVAISSSGQTPTVSINDFASLKGRWNGTLTYLDYGNNKLQTIKANVDVTLKDSSIYELAIFYTDEPKKSGKDSYRIHQNGTKVNERLVIERTVDANGNLKIVLEDKGTDGNDYKPATFNQVLEIGKNSFTITKLVKFDGEKEFFQRNQYVFKR